MEQIHVACGKTPAETFRKRLRKPPQHPRRLPFPPEAVEQAENYHGLEILDVADYHEAVAIADARSQPGDVVILSPASPSFDRFANFMERGQVFKAIVNELK